jgi:beta-glucosidase
MAATAENTTTDYADLIASLSLPEKVTLLTGAAVFTMAGHPGIGLTPMNLSDGPTARRASVA